MRRFVLAWRKLELEHSLGSRIVTYADDLVILCKRGKADEALLAMRAIMGKLKLTVNEEKTRICRVPESSRQASSGDTQLGGNGAAMLSRLKTSASSASVGNGVSGASQPRLLAVSRTRPAYAAPSSWIGRCPGQNRPGASAPRPVGNKTSRQWLHYGGDLLAPLCRRFAAPLRR